MSEQKGSFAIVATSRATNRPQRLFVVNNMTVDEVNKEFNGEWDNFTILNKEPLVGEAEAWSLFEEHVYNDNGGWLRWLPLDTPAPTADAPTVE